LPDPMRADSLAAMHHLVVVLRLVVDTGGRVVHGEVMEPAAASGHRFVGLTGLAGAVRDAIGDWLGKSGGPRRHESDPPSGPTGTESGPVG